MLVACRIFYPLALFYPPTCKTAPTHPSNQPNPMPRPQGPAWKLKYYDVKSRDKHGNKKVKCKSCLKEFTASHTRLVGHFNPDDTIVETCQAATAECLDEMSKYVCELKTKVEAAARIRCVVECVL